MKTTADLLTIEVHRVAELRAEAEAFYERCQRKTSLHNEDLIVVARDADSSLARGADNSIARNDATVVGAVRLCHEEGVFVLRTMQVLPEFQGRGVGQTLLKHFFKLLVDQKIQTVLCMPYTHLEIFYGSIGFLKIPTETAPAFLQARLQQTQQSLSDKSVILMKLDRKPLLEVIQDEELRSPPKDPEAVRAHLQTLKTELSLEPPRPRKLSLLGEMGVHLRSLERLAEAESCLQEALELAESSPAQDAGPIVQQQLRLAHVFQWKKRFAESTALFSKALITCRENPAVRNYLAFALQHAGKNYYDQKEFAKALAFFEEALTLRKAQNAPEDQCRSSEWAAQCARKCVSKTS